MPFADIYRRQVTLLIRILPLIAEEEGLALKGGTAINLFVRDMPRLTKASPPADRTRSTTPSTSVSPASAVITTTISSASSHKKTPSRWPGVPLVASVSASSGGRPSGTRTGSQTKTRTAHACRPC